jgi:hypothetical protein
MRRQIALEVLELRRMWIGAVLVQLLSTGCATTTPAQSAGLQEVPAFADLVTVAYGTARVRAVVDRNREPGTESYDHHAHWISLPPSLLERQDRLVILAPVLAAATLGHRFPPGSTEAARQQRFSAYRRAVEILVKFRAMNTRQAVEEYTHILLARNKAYAAQVAALPGLATVRPVSRATRSGEFWAYFTESLTVSPCDQLRDLWSYFMAPDAPPACESPKI